MELAFHYLSDLLFGIGCFFSESLHLRFVADCHGCYFLSELRLRWVESFLYSFLQADYVSLILVSLSLFFYSQIL